MKRRVALVVIGFVWGALVGLPMLAGADAAHQPGPPIAKIIPHPLEKHDHVRIDNYYWLRERENPGVITYLEAENAYTEQALAHTQERQEVLFEDMKGRIKQDDASVPYFRNDFYYYTRYEEGQEYKLYCRKHGALEAPEEIMLDANAEAVEHEYYAIWGWDVSPRNDILAWAADTSGRKFFTIRFKNLATGELLADVIPNVTSDIVWAADNRTLFYARHDPETLRSYQIYRHVLGTDTSSDVFVYEEADETFDCYVWATKSRKYLMIGSFQTLTTECRYLDAANPAGAFLVIQPRERGHEYSVDHRGDKFYVRTNWNAQNFRLMETSVQRATKEHWREIIPHRDDVLLEDFEVFEEHLLAEERRGGLTQLHIISWRDGSEHYLDFGEAVYLAYELDNHEIDSPILRYRYMSMTTPRSTYDYDMNVRTKTLLKQDEVLGGFDPADYRTERLHATARDGVRVPISIVYHKNLQKDGRNPLLLYGYGAYGASEDATFSSSRLSLLDRGFAYAIAHVRGGEELGRQWYEDGKLLKKMNTFNDFIDCAEFLIAEGYTESERLFALGSSAGGLLMGAIANLRPHLFKGIIADVAWVDVITTMLDPDIPLTTSEYDEWGDANIKEYYDYMLSYSPYDNVRAQSYPHMLVTTGLHDSQVQYWEPAKWVAKLRVTKTDDHLLLLKTNMSTGHFGASGRFEYYREIALWYAFLLDLAGVAP